MADKNVIILENNVQALMNNISGDDLMKACVAGGLVIKQNAMINASRGRPGLAIDSGDLTNSIMVEKDKKTATSASVNVGPSMIYAAIHEFGGVIKAKAARALHFVVDGQHRVAKEVVIPARPYLRPAVDEHLPEIQAAVEASLKSSMGKALK